MQVMLPSSPLFPLHACGALEKLASFSGEAGKATLSELSALNKRAFVQVFLGFPVDEGEKLASPASLEKLAELLQLFSSLDKRVMNGTKESHLSLAALSSSWQTCSSLCTRRRR